MRNPDMSSAERDLLTFQGKKGILNKPCSRGGSGALHLKSAIAGVMACRGLVEQKQPGVSDADVWVSRNGNLRTVSGQECSSTKWNLSCAVRMPGPSQLLR